MATIPKTITTAFADDYKAARMTLSVYARDTFDQGGNSDYERLAPTERDDDFFLQSWTTAASQVADLIRDHILDFQREENTATYVIRTYDETYTPESIATDIADYTRNYMIAEWFKQKSPDTATAYTEAMNTAAASLKYKASFKPRPKLKYFN